MAQDRPAPIDPDDVIKRTFTTVRRGVDPLEVQRYLLELAGQLRAGREREREMAGKLADAESRATPIDQLDPSRLTALLGEETARVLDAARAAAAEIRAKAEENVARLLREARDEAQHARDEAESLVLRRTEEAEAEVERIRGEADGVRERAEQEAERVRAEAEAVKEQAEADAEEVRDGAVAVGERAEADAQARLERAESEAEDVIDAAKAEGREMVAEAQGVRQRMVDDLARRRKQLRQQIEQLQAGRERLLAAYEVVRETLDVATEELHVALPEAKLSAEAASLRAAEDDHDVFLAEVDGRPGGGGDVAEPAGTETDAVETEAAEPVAGGDQGAGGDDEGPPPEVDVPDEGVAAPVAEVDDLVEGEPSTESTESVESEAEEAVAGEGRTSSAVRVVRAESAERTAAIFERLREEGPSEGTGVAGVLVAGEVETPTAEIPTAETPTDTSAEEPSRAHPLLAARDSALGPVGRTLSRKLKRALSDEQNEVLDAIRRQKGTPSLEAVVPTLDEHVERYRKVVRPQLVDAAGAGAALAGSPSDGATTDVDPLVEELVEEVVGPLRERLERAFAESATERDDLAERVRADYREAKAQRVEGPGTRALLGAANLGLIDSVGTDELVVWIVDDDRVASPDCEDNGLAEPQPAGSVFPTGHRVPPLHDACRCIVVPAGR